MLPPSLPSRLTTTTTAACPCVERDTLPWYYPTTYHARSATFSLAMVFAATIDAATDT